MYLFAISLFSYFLIRRIANQVHSLLLVGINVLLIIFYFEFEFQSFRDDSKEYFDNTQFIFENYNLKELIFILFNYQEGGETFIIETNNLFSKIYIFFYIIYYMAAGEPSAIPLFYLLLKCISVVFLVNFTKRNFQRFEEKKIIFIYLILLNPWTIYYQSFFFLKEGLIVFIGIVNIITFYKMVNNFKLHYFFYLVISLIIIFYFRYYLVYVLIVFYFIYFFYSNILSKKENNFIMYLPIFATFLISTFFISYRDFFNIMQEQFNILGPLRYLTSPLFVNVILIEEFSFRSINSLINNIFSFIFFISILKYDYQNKLINFLILFVFTFSASQFFAHPEILTGGRHRGFIFWSMALIVTLLYDYKKTKKNHSLRL